MARAKQEDVIEIIKPTGLASKKAKNIINMTHRFNTGNWSDICQLPGCGPYASDSYAIFVEGRRDVNPDDKVLRLYLQWERDYK